MPTEQYGRFSVLNYTELGYGVVADSEFKPLRSPQEHFNDLEAIFERHAAASEAEVRQLQKSDETANWPTAWKHIYNWHFAQVFADKKIFRNRAAWNRSGGTRFVGAGFTRDICW